MDVRGAALDRIHQHLLQEAHDRRVVHVGVVFQRHGAIGDSGFFFFHVTDQVGQLVGGALVQVLDQLDQLGVLDDDGVDDGLLLELDALDGLVVSRVGQQHGQAVAALDQRDDAGLGQQLAVDLVQGQGAEVQAGQIHQRHAEGLGQEGGQPQRVQHLAVDDQLVEEVAVLGCLSLGMGFPRLLGRQQLVLDQHAGNAGQLHGIGLVGTFVLCLRWKICGHGQPTLMDQEKPGRIHSRTLPGP